MALSRTWYSRSNIPMPDATSAVLLAKSILWLVKASLKNEVTTGTLGVEGAPPGGASWACDGSSDSVSANMTGTDLWGSTFDASKIVRAAAGVAHSWIVISKGGFRICIDWSTGSDLNWTLIGSKNAFTGGSITDRPTSTGEWTIATNQPFNNGVVTPHNFEKVVDANGNFYFHNGQVAAGRKNLALWGSVLTENRAGDLGNFFTAYGYLNTGRGPSGYVLAASVAGRNHANTASQAGIGQDLYSGSASWIGIIEANAVDGKFDTMPFYVVSKTAGSGGCRGKFPDIAFVGAAPVGASEPTTGTQERTVFGDCLVPCSVVPVL